MGQELWLVCSRNHFARQANAFDHLLPSMNVAS